MKTLKNIREEYGITQEELADAFGVTSRTIQNMEKDSSNIKDSLLKKYIQAFDLKYDEIFLGSEYEIFEFQKKKKLKILLMFNESPKVDN
ncbi:helix-turn-helix transcriptional regulator [Enterococcus xiangfangensis]|uniref:helix-turn-helix transcriptional regulator n=1 Tax=Enterococcus xiangfangensis TaxID=1296537 RepID=UPI003D184B6C|nr:XRE family transcriptional regulator [Enterococcus asini]